VENGEWKVESGAGKKKEERRGEREVGSGERGRRQWEAVERTEEAQKPAAEDGGRGWRGPGTAEGA